MEDLWKIYGRFMQYLWRKLMEDLWRIYDGFTEDL